MTPTTPSNTAIRSRRVGAAWPVAVVCLASLSACSMLQEDKVDYTSAKRVSTLEVPPDLTQLNRESRYAMPGSIVTATGYQASAPKQTVSTAATEVGDVRIERAGNQRWIVVKRPAEKLWQPVRDFWQENGFVLIQDQEALGLMETDWAENRAKLPQDFIRSTIGRVFDSLYSTGERDKFRTRFEPGAEPGTTDIFLSHRGMVEVYTSSAKDETRWQPRPADPELEAEMLRRLMVRLGAENQRAEANIASAAAKGEPRAKLASNNDGTGTLEVYERFDRAWRRVGLALDRVGFTVEDRDRSKGLYYVRYVDTDTSSQKKDPSWLDKLNPFKSAEPVASSKVPYRIYVSESGQKTNVQVLTSEGGTDKSETAKKILALLLQQLQ